MGKVAGEQGLPFIFPAVYISGINLRVLRLRDQVLQRGLILVE